MRVLVVEGFSFFGLDVVGDGGIERRKSSRVREDFIPKLLDELVVLHHTDCSVRCDPLELFTAYGVGEDGLNVFIDFFFDLIINRRFSFVL